MFYFGPQNIIDYSLTWCFNLIWLSIKKLLLGYSTHSCKPILCSSHDR